MTVVKEQIQTYSETIYARSGVIQMWIMNKSKELLLNLKSKNLSKMNGINTINTTIPHDKSKTRLFDIINRCFFNKNGKRKYSNIGVRHSKTYFV